MSKRKRCGRRKKTTKENREITERFLKHFGIDATNEHHLIPRSRCGRMNLNGEDIRNKKITRRDIHFAWHFLFRNKTPEEAIVYILANFFPNPSFWLPKNLVIASLVKRAKSKFVIEQIVEDLILDIAASKSNFDPKKIQNEKIRKFFENLIRK